MNELEMECYFLLCTALVAQRLGIVDRELMFPDELRDAIRSADPEAFRLLNHFVAACREWNAEPGSPDKVITKEAARRALREKLTAIAE